MATQTVTFALSQESLDQLDRAAEELHTDRAAIVSRALDQYLSLPHYSESEVVEGLREADAGETSSLEDVMERAKGWGR
jgi:predicted transcriptional regulator